MIGGAGAVYGREETEKPSPQQALARCVRKGRPYGARSTTTGMLQKGRSSAACEPPLVVSMNADEECRPRWDRRHNGLSTSGVSDAERMMGGLDERTTGSGGL
jgi:hypothetical protein